ncbi:MAG: phosphate acyltransferase PlsX [bacterium]
MKIAVDAMGGDRAPAVIVEGALLAAREVKSGIVLVGDEGAVGLELRRLSNGRGNPSTITIRHASETIGMGESPAAAIKAKKDSSLVVAARLVKEGEAAAMVSVGNTGACMTAAFLGLGRLEGIHRPAIAIPIPHVQGTTTVIDAGANVDCRPAYLAQFGVMGEVYAERVLGVAHPRIGLLNVGEEEGKGNELTQEAYALLKASPLNFIGNVEGRDVANGSVDVIVCDGFVGNIVLKMAEGLALAILELVKAGYRAGGPGTALGAWLSRPVFRGVKHTMDPARFGGAPLLGVNGTCIVGHGASSPVAVKNAIVVAERLVDQDVNRRIVERLQAAGLARKAGD